MECVSGVRERGGVCSCIVRYRKTVRVSGGVCEWCEGEGWSV